MSRFYASIQGGRGMATRMGHKSSGITGHIRGWLTGIEVNGRVDDNDNDVFDVYLTRGSNGYGSSKFIGTFSVADLDGE